MGVIRDIMEGVLFAGMFFRHGWGHNTSGLREDSVRSALEVRSRRDASLERGISLDCLRKFKCLPDTIEIMSGKAKISIDGIRLLCKRLYSDEIGFVLLGACPRCGEEVASHVSNCPWLLSSRADLGRALTRQFMPETHTCKEEWNG